MVGLYLDYTTIILRPSFGPLSALQALWPKLYRTNIEASSKEGGVSKLLPAWEIAGLCPR